MIARLRRVFQRLRGGAPDTASAPAPELLARIDQLEGTLRAVEAALASRAEGHTAWLTNLQAGIGDIHSALGGITATVEVQAQHLKDLNDWLTSTVMTVTSMSTVPVLPSPTLQSMLAPAQPVDRSGALGRAQEVWQVMAWLSNDPAERDTLVSVVMPTRNRRDHLERAIQSVLSQRHRRLELVVVDDGSTDSTGELLESVEDPRVTVLRTPGVGQTQARNMGLDAATGQVITYLDDDNLMHPGWLHAVAWAFDRWPDRQLIYGARLVEDAPARLSKPSGAMPSLDFQPFERRRLEQMNYIDMNTIAHLAGLPGARFDETLPSSTDWQLVLTLTAKYQPLELPAIACLYGTYAPNRVADDPSRMDDNRLVRARVHTTRPIRILSFNELFPLVSETYIHEEMRALAANGASIGFTAARKSISPYPIEEPVWSNLKEAIEVHDPDLIFMYWVTHVGHELPLLENLGRPFALRVHSFDFDVEAIRQLQEHPLCAGVWAYPAQVLQLPGAHALAPIFTSHTSMPPPRPTRDLVFSVSAGLPKKNFPLLMEAMDQLSDLDRGIAVSYSNNEEQTIEDLQRMVAERDNPPFLRVNMPRAEVFDNLSRTAVLTYTVHDGVKMGMPMSIVEAMRAGCCVIHADREELREVLGTSWRPYRTVEDIVRHVREVMVGGPTIEAERQANRAFATEHFCAPERGRRFHTEVSEAIEAWRLRVG
jgi:glycosyltransferase involved in cell wall biosynthesis